MQLRGGLPDLMGAGMIRRGVPGCRALYLDCLSDERDRDEGQDLAGIKVAKKTNLQAVLATIFSHKNLGCVILLGWAAPCAYRLLMPVVNVPCLYKGG